MKVIDGKDRILGRLASYVAKELLRGEEITIVNAEECIISGSEKNILEKYKARRARKSLVNPARHGPFFPRRPEGIVRRAVRGMIPYRKAKGRESFRRLRVYVGVPKDFEGIEFEKIDVPKVDKLKLPKYIKVKELSKQLGAKF
jgi:large subunit ribosomal protein L13